MEEEDSNRVLTGNLESPQHNKTQPFQNLILCPNPQHLCLIQNLDSLEAIDFLNVP